MGLRCAPNRNYVPTVSFPHKLHFHLFPPEVQVHHGLMYALQIWHLSGPAEPISTTGIRSSSGSNSAKGCMMATTGTLISVTRFEQLGTFQVDMRMNFGDEFPWSTATKSDVHIGGCLPGRVGYIWPSSHFCRSVYIVSTIDGIWWGSIAVLKPVKVPSGTLSHERRSPKDLYETSQRCEGAEVCEPSRTTMPGSGQVVVAFSATDKRPRRRVSY